MTTNTTSYALQVSYADRDFDATLHVADTGTWSLEDGGLRVAMGPETFNEWLVDVWTTLRTTPHHEAA